MRYTKAPLILITVLLIFELSHAQYCVPNRFDANYFSMSQIDSVTVQYGANYNWQDVAIQKLFLDVYFPKTSADPMAKRPLVVMIHSGGFYLGSRRHFRYHCRELAKRGFVAATIDYRIGWDVGLGKHYDTIPTSITAGYPFKCLGDKTSSIKALYRALQDQKAAIRFLVHNADSIIKVDTTQIYVSGSSAGGVSSLGLQYLTQNTFDTRFAALHLRDSLGPLETATNTLTDSFSLAGMFSMWGAVPDTSLIKATNVIPTLLMHCTGDSLVPCGSSNYYSCSNYELAQGSCEISKRLKNLNACYEYNYFDATPPNNGCHDVYTYDYHIERFSKFMKRQFCNDCRQITVENQVVIADNVLSDEHLSPLDIYKTYVYPNPTKTNLNILSDTRVYGVKIYNLQGKVIKTIFIDKKTAQIKISDLSEGGYIVKVTLVNGSVINRKIIIE
jgi:acetyl esterase/lipase